MVTSQRTSVEALRRELHLRFEEEQFHDPQGASELLSEMVIDPVKESSSFPLFFQRILSRGKDKSRAGRWVPSRSEGAALPSVMPVTTPVIIPFISPTALPSILPYPPFPLHTSRGVTKHGESETEIMTICPAPSDQLARRLILGGYDGGAEAG